MLHILQRNKENNAMAQHVLSSARRTAEEKFECRNHIFSGNTGDPRNVGFNL